MDRLCERPGCSETASVSYGMRPEELVFWLDRLDKTSGDGGGVLCQRHADSMVVPRSWTLDDLRDPDLHLFRPPTAEPTTRRGRRSSGAAAIDSSPSEQLELGVEPAVEHQPVDDVVEPATEASDQESWSPSFDDADDLGGLLAARSPLLARAFRGDDRPRR